DFGATGDGTTNDTIAVQAAIDALAASGGGRLFFPQGYYVCSGGLTVNTSECIELVGEGFQNTIIMTGPSNSVKLVYMDGGRHGLRDLSIGGAGAQTTYVPTVSIASIAGSHHAVHFGPSAVDCIIDRCYVTGGFYGVLNESADLTVSDCTIAFAYGEA